MDKQEKSKGTYSSAFAHEALDNITQEDFSKHIGLKLLEMYPGYAKGEIEIKPYHMNILGIVHGGVMFTMADNLGGVAALNGQPYVVSTINATVNYMRAGKNTSKLVGEATVIKKGKNLSVCECRVMDDKNEVLILCTMTFYHLMPSVKE